MYPLGAGVDGSPHISSFGGTDRVTLERRVSQWADHDTRMPKPKKVARSVTSEALLTDSYESSKGCYTKAENIVPGTR